MRKLLSVFIVLLLAQSVLAAEPQSERPAKQRAASQPAASKADEIRGILNLPDGSPAANVRVSVGTGMISISGMRVNVNLSSETVTAADGSFSLRKPGRAFALVALDERGYAEAGPETLKKSSVLTLKPWAKVEGVIRVGSRPGGGEVAMLSHDFVDGDGTRAGDFFDNARVSSIETVAAEEDGHFVLERFPPGRASIGRKLTLEGSRFTTTNSIRMDLEPAHTTKVTVGGTGRPVVGKFATTAPAEQVRWSRGHSRISQKREFGAKVDPLKFVSFPISVKADGSFRVEDVPPGEYDVSITIYAPPAWDDRSPYGLPIGTLRHEFKVAEIAGGQSDEPLDLGKLGLTAPNQASAVNRSTISAPSRLLVGSSKPSRLLDATVSPSPGTRPTATEMQNQILVRILDPGGKPVEGARIGTTVQPPGNSGQGQWVFFGMDQRSDAYGEIRLEPSLLSTYRGMTREVAFYVLHVPRGLVGLFVLTATDIGKQLTWTLAPSCRVHGQLTSPALKSLGRDLSWSMAYLYWKKFRPLEMSSDQLRFEFLLPPGEFRLNVYGTGTTSVNETIEIKPGERDREVNIELPANRLALLEGHPAPELREIKAWGNGLPVKLSELRGKVVLLDFWGWWCGPCVAAMPELISLHRTLADRGLVIVAVHDDSFGTAQELEKQVAELARTRWGGETLPFRIALAGGGETQIQGSKQKSRGAVCADYGITEWPTTVLIDRQGKVANQTPGAGSLRSQIERLLAGPSTTAPAPQP